MLKPKALLIQCQIVFFIAAAPVNKTSNMLLPIPCYKLHKTLPIPPEFFHKPVQKLPAKICINNLSIQSKKKYHKVQKLHQIRKTENLLLISVQLLTEIQPQPPFNTPPKLTINTIPYSSTPTSISVSTGNNPFIVVVRKPPSSYSSSPSYTAAPFILTPAQPSSFFSSEAESSVKSPC